MVKEKFERQGKKRIKIIDWILNFLIVIFGILIIVSLIISLASSQTVTQSNVCCEKTKNGAWCQNDLAVNCDANFRQTPTSCDATSFCKGGCCFDSQEGICMENTPEKVCSINNGTWADSKECEIGQCGLGCCVLGEQASFVTLTRCKKLSGFYGLKTDFRKNIQDELSCIAVAQSQDKGACVYEGDYIKTCKFTIRGECVSGLKGVNETITNATTNFYKDFLCSAEELGTICGPTTKTACLPGKDEVYFVDSCGNPANIYDSARINDKSYWRKIIKKEESCQAGTGSINSQACGNCDYFSGSFCQQYSRSMGDVRPKYGDYVCRDLNCKKVSTGGSKRHGETWCYYDAEHGDAQDPVGSRYYRHLCYMGEELVESCADFRQEQCIEDSFNGFSQAGCRVNRWQDCMSQETQLDCENKDKRDCVWLPEYKIPVNDIGLGVGGFANATPATSAAGGTTQQNDSDKKKGKTHCFPDVTPGLKFWEAGEAQGICSIANSQCVVEFEKKLFGDKKCVKNCDCLDKEAYGEKQNEVCTRVGDCGAGPNFIGQFGYQPGYKVTSKKPKTEEESKGGLGGLLGFVLELVKES